MEPTFMQVHADQTYTLKSPTKVCSTHGEVTNWIQVAQEDGYPHNGFYCQKCYVENVIVPNCKRLTAP